MPRQDVDAPALLEVVAELEEVGVFAHCLQGLELAHEYRFDLGWGIRGNFLHSKEVSRELMADDGPLTHLVVREDVLHVQVLIGTRGEILVCDEVLGRF